MMGIFMTEETEGPDTIRELFIARGVSAGHSREEVEEAIAGFTSEDLAEKSRSLDEVLGLGTELMRSHRRPVSPNRFSFYRLVLGQSPYSDGPKISGSDHPDRK